MAGGVVFISHFFFSFSLNFTFILLFSCFLHFQMLAPLSDITLFPFAFILIQPAGRRNRFFFCDP